MPRIICARTGCKYANRPTPKSPNYCTNPNSPLGKRIAEITYECNK